MKTNFSMLFYIKKQKNYKTGPAPVYLRITVEGKRAELTTGREYDPGKWNPRPGRANGTKEETRNLNAFLDNLQFQVDEAHRMLDDKRETITAEALKNKVLGKDQQDYMLMEIFKDHNRKVGTLVGEEFAHGTLKQYETSLKHTVEFLDYKYGGEDIDVRKINHSFIIEYDFFLRSETHMCERSTWQPL